MTEVQVSPSGGWVVFAVRWADAAEDRYTSDLYLVSLASTVEAAGASAPPAGPAQPADAGPDAPVPEARRLTQHPASDSAPLWSPDGRRVAFLSDRAGTSQVYVLDLGGGEPLQVTEAKEGVEEFDWSPDGEWVVYAAKDPKGNRGDGEKDFEKEKSSREPFVITRALIKVDGVGYLDERRHHLWVAPSRGGQARRLTGGEHGQARFDDRAPRWSPDGGWIAFVSNHTEDPDRNNDTDIWLVSPRGGEPRRLTSSPGADQAPSWSPDGRSLAWVSRLPADDYFRLENLMVAELDGGKPRNLSGRLDRWVADRSVLNGAGRGPALWSADGRTLYITTEHGGRHVLTSFPVDGGEPRDLLRGPFSVDYLGLERRAGRFVFALTDPVRPYDIYTSDLEGGDRRRLTALNDGILGELKLSRPEVFQARNSRGEEVESWFYPPAPLPAGGRAPLILYIHGGPVGFDGEYWEPGSENHLFAGAGWAVLRVNYRGSSSYGEKFAHAVFGNWHYPESEDLMAALDGALRRYAYLDPARLGIGGWSWGGILTIWTVGHTDRFAVGVPERFAVGYPGSYGVDQWHVWYETELGSPIRNRDKYWRHSPLRLVEKIRTPLYLIANADDWNCPASEAERFYQHLKYLKRPAELVIYPGEPHSMGRPSHRVDRLERLRTWFGRHLEEAKP